MLSIEETKAFSDSYRKTARSCACPSHPWGSRTGAFFRVTRRPAVPYKPAWRAPALSVSGRAFADLTATAR